MAVDYSAYKPVVDDANYPTKINGFIDAVQADMNSKQDTSLLWARQVVTKTSDYTVADTDYTIIIDSTVDDVTITLPAAASYSGRVLVFRRKDASGYLANVGTVCTLDIQNESVTIQSDGANWLQVN